MNNAITVGELIAALQAIPNKNLKVVWEDTECLNLHPVTKDSVAFMFMARDRTVASRMHTAEGENDWCIVPADTIRETIPIILINRADAE